MEAESWEVTVRLTDYRQARRLFELAQTLPNSSWRFCALDANGEPLWTDEDEARFEATLRDT